ncbi:hypothetical protein [Kitasatospora sp. NPDC004289]
MQWWSVSAFVVSTVAVAVLANLRAFLAWRRADRALTRALAELDERTGALYPATLLAHGRSRYDTVATGWAAIHRARRPLRDGELDHPLTALAREVVDRGHLQDVTELTEGPDFRTAHGEEARWVADRIPGPEQEGNLVPALMGFPAVVISGWMALCTVVGLAAWLSRTGAAADDTSPPDDGSGAYGGAVLAGLLVWLVGFAVVLAVQALFWYPVRERWLRRLRDRSAQLVQRELGDAHDAFLADLGKGAADTLRAREER